MSNTTTTKSTRPAATPKVSKGRTAPAIPADADDFAGKVRTALTKSVDAGTGEVRVRVADPSDRVAVRKIQKRVQALGYSAGWNANFRVTLAGDILTGRVVDLTVTDQRPGHTDPTAKTPGTRSKFVGWTPAQITAWKEANPVRTFSGNTTPTPTKVTKKVTPKVTRKVTRKVTTGTPTVPQSLAGVTSATPVDTTKVTTRKVTRKVTPKV